MGSMKKLLILICILLSCSCVFADNAEKFAAIKQELIRLAGGTTDHFLDINMNVKISPDKETTGVIVVKMYSFDLLKLPELLRKLNIEEGSLTHKKLDEGIIVVFEVDGVTGKYTLIYPGRVKLYDRCATPLTLP